MIVTIASGKGGTGKTTVAVNLALSLAEDGQDVADRASGEPARRIDLARPLFLDCDVEEPNAALFLRPAIEEQREVGQMVPEVDFALCTYCGRCAEVCQYHAVAVIGGQARSTSRRGEPAEPSGQVLVFPELCHGCGSCSLNCPTGAIHEVLHVMGTVERGWAGPVEFAQGTMNVGQAMAVPIIRQLKHWAIPPEPGDRPVLLDAPPGTACPVVESMRGADFVLMVTEPTPFGLHDLRLAVEVARGELGLPVGVVVNREGVGDRGVDDYCVAEGIPILMRIPLDRRIAEAYSEGVPLVEAFPEYGQRFRDLYASIEEVQGAERDGKGGQSG